MSLLKRFLASLSLLSFFLNPLAAYAQMIPQGEIVNTPTLLSASDYGITESATELPAERTLRTATFDLGNGKRAQVSVSPDLFTHNPLQPDTIVFANSTGIQKGNSFVFDYLPQDTRVSFDLTKPSYTLTKGAHSFTLSFPTESSIAGTIRSENQVSYPLSENATLIWTVEGTNVKKEIFVKNNGTAHFEFTIDSNLVKTLSNNSVILSNGSKEIFRTEKPYLLTTDYSPLLTSVSLIQNAQGNYEYVYDESSLPSEYILDPSAGPNGPGTAQSDGGNGGTKAWDNVSSVLSDDGNTTSAMSFTEKSEYLRVNNFGFNINTSADIAGIEVTIDGTNYSSTTYLDVLTMKLVNASGTPFGNNKETDTWGSGPLVLGGSNDLWGATITPSIVNDTDFGFVYDQQSLNYLGTSADIDYISIKVYYTLTLKSNGDSCTTGAECTGGSCYGNVCSDQNADQYRVIGKLYSDFGVTPVQGKTIKVAVNGTYIPTQTGLDYNDVTSATGGFDYLLGYRDGDSCSGTCNFSAGDIITIWIDGDSNNAVTIVKREYYTVGGSPVGMYSIVGANLYYNYLSLMDPVSDGDSHTNITSANLQTGSVQSDSDVTDIFSMSSNNLTMGANTTLYVSRGTPYAPSANTDLVSLTNSGTTLLTNLGSSSFTISGNLSSIGTFTPSTKTVTLDGSNQTLSGSSLTFYNLTKTGGGGNTLTINGTVTASNSLTLAGTSAGSLMTIADVGASIFKLTSGGSQSLSYLSVANMSAAGGDTLNCTTSCTDGGSNTNWNFGGGGDTGGTSGSTGGSTGGGDVPEFSTYALIILLGGCFFLLRKNVVA